MNGPPSPPRRNYKNRSEIPRGVIAGSGLNVPRSLVGQQPAIKRFVSNNQQFEPEVEIPQQQQQRQQRSSRTRIEEVHDSNDEWQQSLLTLATASADVIIGEDVEIKGDFHFEGLLHLLGRFEGRFVSTGDVFVGPKAVLKANLAPNTIRRLLVDGGHVTGKLHVDQVGIIGRSIVRGEINCRGLWVGGSSSSDDHTAGDSIIIAKVKIHSDPAAIPIPSPRIKDRRPLTPIDHIATSNSNEDSSSSSSKQQAVQKKLFSDHDHIENDHDDHDGDKAAAEPIAPVMTASESNRQARVIAKEQRKIDREDKQLQQQMQQAEEKQKEEKQKETHEAEPLSSSSLKPEEPPPRNQSQSHNHNDNDNSTVAATTSSSHKKEKTSPSSTIIVAEPAATVELVEDNDSRHNPVIAPVVQPSQHQQVKSPHLAHRKHKEQQQQQQSPPVAAEEQTKTEEPAPAPYDNDNNNNNKGDEDDNKNGGEVALAVDSQATVLLADNEKEEEETKAKESEESASLAPQQDTSTGATVKEANNNNNDPDVNLPHDNRDNNSEDDGRSDVGDIATPRKEQQEDNSSSPAVRRAKILPPSEEQREEEQAKLDAFHANAVANKLAVDHMGETEAETETEQPTVPVVNNEE